MNYQKYSVVVGFVIWLVATIAFRVAGQYFFLTDDMLMLALLYLLPIPALGSVAYWVFYKFRLSKLEAVQSAVLMVLPGMLFDTVCIQYFAWIFPNLPASDNATFGSWLMWAYALVLAFGLMWQGRE